MDKYSGEFNAVASILLSIATAEKRRLFTTDEIVKG